MTERVIKMFPNMIKAVIAIMIMVVSMAMFVGNINKANSATPIPDVIVTGDNITLGDVFDGIDKNAGFVLAPAPKPDTVLTWDARTLNRIAKAFDLPFTANATDQIRIRRLASLVSEEMIEDAILAALKQDGLSGKYDLDFVGGRPEIFLPHDMDAFVTVESSSYNASRQTFSATIRTPDDKIRQLSGIAYPLIAIPVLNAPLGRGDIITKNMLTTLDVRADTLSDSAIIRKEDIIGLSPRRMIRADMPVDMSDLNKPTMVSRGDLVTMELKNGPIAITAIAKAMESGAKGDTIRLLNVDSKRTLEAEVIGLRTARVYN